MTSNGDHGQVKIYECIWKVHVLYNSCRQHVLIEAQYTCKSYCKITQVTFMCIITLKK